MEKDKNKKTPCEYPMNLFFNFKEDVPKGTRVSNSLDCEICYNTRCDVKHCLLKG